MLIGCKILNYQENESIRIAELFCHLGETNEICLGFSRLHQKEKKWDRLMPLEYLSRA
jgi:hypothetical protein